VFSRGTGPGPLVLDDGDRAAAFAIVRSVVGDEGWDCLMVSLLTTHYHLVVRTRDGLSHGMQRLNHGIVRSFNRRHGRRGALVERRFCSVPVVRDAHLIHLVPYVALNAWRAGLCDRPEDWSWSNYPGLIGIAPRLPFASEELLGLFGGSRDRLRAYVEHSMAIPPRLELLTDGYDSFTPP
jgi:putative transposase